MRRPKQIESSGPSLGMTGKVHSEESKEKMRAAHKKRHEVRSDEAGR